MICSITYAIKKRVEKNFMANSELKESCRQDVSSLPCNILMPRLASPMATFKLN
jgi:hypothetical protein